MQQAGGHSYTLQLTSYSWHCCSCTSLTGFLAAMQDYCARKRIKEVGPLTAAEPASG